MNVAEHICFLINKPMVISRDKHLIDAAAKMATINMAGSNPATFDKESYSDWRKDEQIQQYDDHFPRSTVSGKRVLDFGCGDGALSFYAAQLGASRVVGIDLIEGDILKAKARVLVESMDNPPTFQLSGKDAIPFEDSSFDVILCFDVLEHIFDYPKIMLEWKRVLAPEGRILIYWQPYFHPYGHHLMSYIPMPWAHVIFSDRTLATTCKAIYHMPEYQPRYWEQDEKGNKMTDRKFSGGGVNGLTISGFEKAVSQVGLKLLRNEPHPFSGPRSIRALSSMAMRLPLLREFFTAYLIYEIGHAI